MINFKQIYISNLPHFTYTMDFMFKCFVCECRYVRDINTLSA